MNQTTTDLVLAGAVLFFATPPAAAAGPRPPKAPPAVKTYSGDGRAPIEQLYRGMDALAREGPWDLATVFTDQGLPIRVLTTKHRGPAVWILAGIHGEEPAPPNAVLRSRAALQTLAAKKIPVVLFPLCNPVGYAKGWRYPDARRGSEEPAGHSVGDSEHLLLSKDGKPRVPKAASPQADALTRTVLALARAYPPVLSLDLHEDDTIPKGYIYSQGPQATADPAARAILGKMAELGYPVAESGQTRFGEKIVDGVIAGVNDGSVDELIASDKIVVGGTPRPGPAGHSVIVVETSSQKTSWEERVKLHRAVIAMAEKLFRLASAPEKRH